MNETGLESDFGGRGFDGSRTVLKLGLPPTDPKLHKESQRHIRAEEGQTVDGMAVDIPDDLMSAPPPTSDVDMAAVGPHGVAPTPDQLPPYPSSFRMVDVRREVEKIREARKRIRLGPEAFAESRQAKAARAASKPSVCLFTVHDAGDGYAFCC
jgi:transcription initiation factor TFIID subunit 5